MAGNEKETEKKSPIILFREKIMGQKDIQLTIMEGLKSTNARVRSLAIKLAFKTQDHPFMKKNVLPLIANDKSKKVLRTLSEKITRKELTKKVKSLLAPKKIGKAKAAAEPEAAAAASAPAKEA